MLAADDVRAGRSRGLRASGRPLELALGDQRAELVVLAPGADRDAASALAATRRDDVVECSALDQQPRARRAALARVLDQRVDDRRDGLVEVARRRRRRWATCRRARARSVRAGARRPRRRGRRSRRSRRTSRGRRQGAAASAAPVVPSPVAIWIIPRGTPASSRQLGEAQRRDRGQLGRLDDHRVAGRERGRGAAGGDLERVVPGDDLRAHAPRLAHRVVEDVRAERDLAAFEALDRARVVVEIADGGGDVGLGLRERLAGVAGLELGAASSASIDGAGEVRQRRWRG